MDIDLSIDLPTIVVMVALVGWLWRVQVRAEERLKSDIAGLKQDLKSDLAEVKNDLKSDMAELKDDMEKVEAVARQTDRDLAYLAGRLEPYLPQAAPLKPKLLKGKEA